MSMLLRIGLAGLLLSLPAFYGCTPEGVQDEETESPALDQPEVIEDVVPPETPQTEVLDTVPKDAVENEPEPAPEPQAALPEGVYRMWDFASPQAEKSPWTFRGRTGERNNEGVVFFAFASGPGLVYRGEAIPTDEVEKARLHMKVLSYDEETKKADLAAFERPPRLYWADLEQTSMNEDDPYDEERSVELTQPEPNDPTLWEAPLADAENWDGTVVRLMMDLPVEDLEQDQQPYAIIVNSITLEEAEAS